jgi:hypothetical protein
MVGPGQKLTVSRQYIAALVKAFRPKDTSDRLVLTGCHLSGLDLNNITFRNICFSDRRPGRSAQFLEIEMRGCTFENCSFAAAEIVAVSFRGSTFTNCDLRYVSFRNTTFMETTFSGCDFYRSTFEGNNVFEGSAIHYTSFHLAVITGTDLRRANLRTPMVQEDVDAFLSLLRHFKTVPEDRMEHFSAMGPREAVDIYRAFSGFWTSRGYLGDATWAYVRARRLELRCDLPPCSWNAPVHDAYLRNVSAPGQRQRWIAVVKGLKRALPALVMDLTCGFGSSLIRVVGTVCCTFLFFALLDFTLHSLIRADHIAPTFMDCLTFSLHSMIAEGADGVRIKPAYDLIPTLQTAMGLALVGLFGFVLGNSVRNS